MSQFRQPTPYSPPQQPVISPPLKPPDHKRRNAWLIIGTVLLVAFIISAIIGAAGGTSSSPSPTPTTDTAPTPSSAQLTAADSTAQAQLNADATTQAKPKGDERLQVQGQVNQIAQGKATFSQHLDSNYVPDTQSIVITSLLSDFASNDNGRTEAKSDCFAIQQALWQNSDVHLTEIEIHFTANLVDQYGKPVVDMVALCTLKKQTAAKFQWSNLDGGSAWDNGDYDQATFFSLLTNP